MWTKWLLVHLGEWFYLLSKADLLLYLTIKSDNIIVPCNNDFKGLDSFPNKCRLDD